MSSKLFAAGSAIDVRAAAAAGIFAAATFTGAVLMFLLEPMFVKMALPRLGGSSEVWTACMLFYQAMLLGGYAYAHMLLRLPQVRMQAVIHLAACAAALIVLPVAIPAAWQPASPATAVPWLLTTLLATVGLPFFVLSATSPLMQAWFGLSLPSRNPYALYAASNVGSLVALVLYPFAIEPQWGLHAQSSAWTSVYAIFVLMLAATAIVARNAVRADGGRVGLAAVALPTRRRLRWVVLAFVPSSLMLSVTTYLSERVAPIPLLWTLPLGIYLASFVFVFGTGAQRGIAFANRYTPLVLMPLVFVLSFRGALPAVFEIAMHVVVFAGFAIVCHGALAQDRPDVTHLTEFYLYVALGGVLGGVFNGLVAPALFSDVFEYPLVIVLACFLLQPRNPESRDRPNRPDILAPLALMVGVGALLVATASLAEQTSVLAMKLTIAAGAIAGYTFVERHVRFALGVAGLLAAALARGTLGGDLHVERNFYGVKHVMTEGPYVHTLVHGHTVHGAEDMRPAAERIPQTYYTHSGPLGDIFRTRAPRPTVAVVGLGAGTTACYRAPDAAWTFYEIDPGVVSIARDPRLFRYLADCAPQSPVVVGDARLSLTAAPLGAFDLMILDAYSSDAIPTHLLTREAMALYVTRLRPHGAIAFHISNSYFDFAPLVAALAADAGMLSRERDDRRSRGAEAFFTPSNWMLVARTLADLGALAGDPKWVAVRPGPRVWTDDYSSIVTLLRPGR